MKIKSLKSQVKDIDSKGIVTVAANAFGNIDSDKDISMSGSYNKTINEFFHRVKWFLNHDTTLLLGVPMEAKEEGDHLVVTGQLNMNKQLSRDIYEDYKLYAEHDRTLEHSVGVQAIKFQNKDNGVREVTEWKWWEYSTLTNWGANENTPLIGLKSQEKLLSELDFMEKRLTDGNYSDEYGKYLEQVFDKMKSIQQLYKEPVTATPEPEQSTQERIKEFRKHLKL